MFIDHVEDDERIAPAVAEQVGIAAGDGVDFVPSDDLAAAIEETGIDEASAAAIVDDYESAQLRALKTGLLVTGVLALASLMSTRNLPAALQRQDGDTSDPATAAAAGSS